MIPELAMPAPFVILIPTHGHVSLPQTTCSQQNSSDSKVLRLFQNQFFSLICSQFCYWENISPKATMGRRNAKRGRAGLQGQKWVSTSLSENADGWLSDRTLCPTNKGGSEVSGSSPRVKKEEKEKRNKKHTHTQEKARA